MQGPLTSDTLVLFAGNDLTVRANRHEDTSNVVVTFSHIQTGEETARRDGFAEDALNRQRITNCVFVSHRNHWWQTPEMQPAVAAAAAFIRDCEPDRVTAYGSSMGAYGALMYSGPLHCTHVLALGPQYSIDPNKVPGEKRWQGYARQLDFKWDDMTSALRSGAEKFVLYDPATPDKAQVALMEGVNLNQISVPHGGHQIGKHLLATQQLKPTLRALIDGRLGEDIRTILQTARRNHRSSPGYRNALLDRCADRPAHRRLYGQLLRDHVRNHPHDFRYREMLAQLLLEIGHLKEARRHAELAAASNRHPLSSLRLLRDVAQAMGDWAAMREAKERIAVHKELRAAQRSTP